MLINRQTPKAPLKKAPASPPKSQDNPIVDGFSRGVGLTSDLILIGGSTYAGLEAAGEILAESVPQAGQALKTAVGLAGAVAGAGFGAAVCKGLDKLGSKLSKENPQRASAALKAGLTMTLVGLGAESGADIAEGATYLIAGGGIGMGVNVAVDKLTGSAS